MMKMVKECVTVRTAELTVEFEVPGCAHSADVPIPANHGVPIVARRRASLLQLPALLQVCRKSEII